MNVCISNTGIFQNENGYVFLCRDIAMFQNCSWFLCKMNIFKKCKIKQAFLIRGHTQTT